MANEKIIIGIDHKTIELKGADKEAFIAQREADKAEALLFEKESQTKQNARDLAIKKLAEVAGLTEAELNAIL